MGCFSRIEADVAGCGVAKCVAPAQGVPTVTCNDVGVDSDVIEQFLSNTLTDHRIAEGLLQTAEDRKDELESEVAKLTETEASAVACGSGIRREQNQVDIIRKPMGIIMCQECEKKVAVVKCEHCMDNYFCLVCYPTHECTGEG